MAWYVVVLFSLCCSSSNGTMVRLTFILFCFIYYYFHTRKNCILYMIHYTLYDTSFTKWILQLKLTLFNGTAVTHHVRQPVVFIGWFCRLVFRQLLVIVHFCYEPFSFMAVLLSFTVSCNKMLRIITFVLFLILRPLLSTTKGEGCCVGIAWA